MLSSADAQGVTLAKSADHQDSDPRKEFGSWRVTALLGSSGRVGNTCGNHTSATAVPQTSAEFSEVEKETQTLKMCFLVWNIQPLVPVKGFLHASAQYPALWLCLVWKPAQAHKSIAHLSAFIQRRSTKCPLSLALKSEFKFLDILLYIYIFAVNGYSE